MSTRSTTFHFKRIQNPAYRRIAWAAWIITALLALLGTLFVYPQLYQTALDGAQSYAADLQRLHITPQAYALFFLLMSTIVRAVYLFTGVFLAYYRADDMLTLFLGIALVTFGLAVDTSTILITADPLTRGIMLFIRLVANITLTTGIYIFPDGRFMPRWTRWGIFTFIVFDVIRLALVAATPPGSSAYSGVIGGLFAFTLIFSVLGAWSQTYRYRKTTDPIQRQQIKWVVLGIAISVGWEAVRLILSTIITALAIPHTLELDIVISTLGYIFPLVGPISVLFAMLRFRLYDVDLVINRSLVFGIVTLTMAVLCLVLFNVSQVLLTRLFGQGQSSLAIAVSEAAAALLFNPTRHRVQKVIDRRLYRFNFDLNQLAAAQRALTIKNPGMLTGRVLGHYDVRSVVGKGGMGEVYRGLDLTSQTEVAIKVLHPSLVDNDTYTARFHREARAMQVLNHPGIARFRDSGIEESTYYLVIDYVDGIALSDYLKEKGALPYEEARRLLKALAVALDYAHIQGIVHRDIKPSNVMLKTGTLIQPVLMDFGVAKITDSTTHLTGSGAIGTIDYMAPEQIMSAQEVTATADIYALGVMAFEMLTGKKPFEGGPAQVMFAHLQQPPPNPLAMAPDMNVQAAAAILQAMEKDPTMRFETAGEFIALL